VNCSFSRRHPITRAVRLNNRPQLERGRQRDLSLGHERIGDALLAAKDFAGAAQAYRESLIIAENLAKASPTDADVQRDLSIAYDKLGKALMDGGQLQEALQTFRASLSLREKLAADNPVSVMPQVGLAVSYERIGDTLMKMQEHAAALEAYQKQLAVFQRLTTTNPDQPKLQNDLSAAYQQIGQTMLALDRLDEALTAHQTALALREKQLLAAPENAGRMRNVWLSRLSVGHVLDLLQRQPEAMELYRQSLAEKLNASTGAWWTLTMTGEYIGNTAAALGLEEESLSAHRRSIAALRRQVELEPQNADLRNKLHKNLSNMGRALLAFGKPENAASFYQEALMLAPTDIYSVLWLHLARHRAGQDDRAELVANAEKLDQSQWPWPVVAYYLGTLDPAQLGTAAAAPESPQARKEQTCEANFYLGAAPAKGATVEAQRRLRAAVAECPKGFIEYSAAKLELKRLDALATATKQ